MLSKLFTRMNKRGQLGNLQSLTLGLVVTAVLIAVGFQILAGVQAGLVTDSEAYNATGTVITAIDTNIVDNIGLIALIAVMSVVLFLVAGFATRR